MSIVRSSRNALLNILKDHQIRTSDLGGASTTKTTTSNSVECLFQEILRICHKQSASTIAIISQWIKKTLIRTISFSFKNPHPHVMSLLSLFPVIPTAREDLARVKRSSKMFSSLSLSLRADHNKDTSSLRLSMKTPLLNTLQYCFSNCRKDSVNAFPFYTLLQECV